MTKNKSIFSKKILSSIVFLLFFNGLFASNSKKVVFSNYEQKILKNLRITPANFLLKANDFTTKTSNGRKVSLKDFHGRFIFLNFWATWCYPCLKEMPDLEKAYKNIGEDKLVILAVAMGEGIERIRKFSKNNNYTFPLLADPNMEISKMYGVKNIPVTYIIDSKGIILGRALGIRNWSNPDLLNLIKSRLD